MVKMDGLPGERLQSRNDCEVPIPGRQWQFILASQGCDPEVVVRNEGASLSEFGFELAIVLSGVVAGQQKDCDSQKVADLSNCFLAPLCSLRAVVEFAQHHPWQINGDFGEARSQIGVPAKVRNYDAGIQEGATSGFHRPFRSLPR